jgi:isoleucyl-tRNA synthetase
MAFQSTVGDKISFVAEEENVLKYWSEINAFKTSLELSKDRPEYTFYDGPPFATGLPHYGHILAGTIKVRLPIYILLPPIFA